ncbi:hypothetical protein ACHAXA_009142 [Cyclostephanos tholiformis]|uniref:RNA 2-O ribose methyltransferase substrate binding domain-containing protein n=1 Tax=Cyclostephanos tholiformis TaxID=382380 RepID=A0ABD3RWY4_9STRA
MTTTTRSDAKREASSEILSLAASIGLPIIEVDKGVLNALCGSRPHQGYVLRCGRLDFVPARRLHAMTTDGAMGRGGRVGPSLWLALDEVVDPQNLGALLRSAYFLGGGPGGIIDDEDVDYADDNDTTAEGKKRRGYKGGVGILVCSKNSSPLSPTVSAASAGALELMTIYSTSNLPKLLNSARDDGWTVLGAAADVPDGAAIRGGGGGRDDDDDNIEYGHDNDNSHDNDNNEWDLGDNVAVDRTGDDDDAGFVRPKPRCFDLNEVKTGKPTIIVLGSEGRGLRTLVARACTGFVRIPGGLGGIVGGDTGEDEGKTRSGVDSLNVSVTGGILLWHFLWRQ